MDSMGFTKTCNILQLLGHGKNKMKQRATEQGRSEGGRLINLLGFINRIQIAEKGIIRNQTSSVGWDLASCGSEYQSD